MKKSWIARIVSTLLFIPLLSFWVFGEGTPQLRPNATDSAMIKLINTVPGVISTGFARYQDTSVTKYKMYVHVCDLTEKVYMGFNIGNDANFNVSVTVIAPDGITLAFPLTVIPKTNGPGYIANYAQAVAGPNTLTAGGYSPFTFNPTQLGDYSIEFKINNLPAAGTSGGRGNSFIKYFDVTVANAGNVAKPGRLWSKAWDISVRTSANTFNGAFFVYTSDKIVSKITMDGLIPQEFIFSANNTGVKSTADPVDDRKSVTGNTTYPSYPVFLNNPDISCFPTGAFGTVVSPPTLSGCPGNYCLNVNVTTAGNGTLFLELNGTAGYQSGTADRALLKTLVAGANCFAWDGKDGLGNVVADASVAISFKYENGITHIPMFDVERNPKGFTVAYIRPVPSTPRPIALFWDDSKVGGTVNTAVPCTGPCHTWTGSGAGDIGDGNTINTWWFGADTTVSSTVSLQREVDANRNLPGRGKGNDTSVCASLKTVSLAGSSTGVPAVKWNVLVGSGTIANDVSLTTTYTLSKADSSRSFLLLELVSAGDACPVVRDTIRVLINPLPNVSALPLNPVTCVGASVTLNGAGASTYVWDKGITNNVAFLISTTTKYTVTGTDAKGCKDTASTTVFVNAPPLLSAVVSGTTSCSNAGFNPSILVSNGQIGIRYEARLDSAKGTLLGTTVPTATGPFSIVIDRTQLKAAPSTNIIYVTAFIQGCGTSTLNDTTQIKVNLNPPVNLIVTGATICSNATNNPSVGINGAQAEVCYEAHLDSARGVLLGTFTPIINGNINIVIDRTKLKVAPSDNIVYFTATIAGCGTSTLNNTANVRVNLDPTLNLPVLGDTVCSNSTSVVTVKIGGAQRGVTYEAHLDSAKGTLLGTSIALVNGNLSIIVDRTKLAPATSDNVIYITATILGCGTQTLSNTAKIRISKNPGAGALVAATGPVCVGGTSIVTITGTEPKVTYSILENTIFRTSILATTNVATKGIIMNNLGVRTISIEASIEGCLPVELTNKAIVQVDSGFNTKLRVIGNSPICLGDTHHLVIEKSEIGVSYQVFEDFLTLSVIKAGNNANLTFAIANLKEGTHILRVQALTPGCGAGELETKPIVIVNPLPNDSLLVLIGDTICSTEDSASVTVLHTKKGVTYQAVLGTIDQGPSKTSPANDATLVLKIPSAPLAFGNNTIRMSGEIGGCKKVYFAKTALVIKNKLPDGNNLILTGDTICSNSDSAYVQVANTEIRVRYRAKLGIDVVGSAKTSTADGATVILGIERTALQIGNNTLSLTGTIPGCSELTFADKTVIVRVNESPDSTLGLVGDTVCSNSAFATVKVIGSKAGESYQAYEESKPIGSPVLSAGGTVILTLPIGSGQLDPTQLVHELKVKSTINGCIEVTLRDSAFVLINTQPDTLLVVKATSPVCLGSTADITLEKTSPRVTYTLLQTQVVATKQGTDSSLVFTITPVAEGFQVYTVETSVKGCQPANLKNKATVKVNRSANDSLNVSELSPICLGSATTITVLGTDTVSTYQVWEESLQVSTELKGNGSTLNFAVANLTEGLHKLVIKANTPGCGLISLVDTAFVHVNGSPSVDSVGVEGSSVCPGEDAIAVLTKVGTGVTYSLFINDQPTSLQVIGSGQSDTLLVPASLLTQSSNHIRFTAGIAACNVANVLDRDTIFVLNDLGFDVQGDRLLCFSDTGGYMTNGIQGALSYQWTLADSAWILQGQGTKNVLVKFDSLDVTVRVQPVGMYGVCKAIVQDMPVTIQAPITGSPFITGNPIVCQNDRDTLKVSNQQGVSYYVWSFSNGINLEDSVITDSVSKKYRVHYPVPGYQNIIAKPYSQCAKAFGEPVVKRVRVLALPVAEANEYPYTEMQGTVATIKLNGQGSTPTGAGINDSISYHWYTEKSIAAQISNDSSLTDAVLTTNVKEFKVYIIVKNNDRCPVVDSAIIRLFYDIDVPNVFSPNNDGTHDKWEIRNLNTLYPQAMVEVYNKWGSLVWKSSPGYPEPWDGTRNGEQLPVATYYYMLDKKDGTKPEVKALTILR